MGVFEVLRQKFDKLRGNNLHEIDSGMYRSAYRIQTDAFGKDYRGKVVKTARDREAVNANRAEFQTWMSVKGTKFESYFCPIVDRSKKFEFIIMDYADVGSADTDDADSLRRDLKSDLVIQDINFSGQSMLDIHRENVGYHKNHKLVLIDYPWGADWKPL